MRHIIRLTSLCGLLACVSACSNVSQLSDKNPEQAQGFNARLAAEYLGYAQSEKDMGEKDDAEYYAAKGLRASKGEDVQPEMVPDSFRRSKKNYSALTKARSRLIKGLSGTAKTAKPQLAARTQMLFDCWVDQRQEQDNDDVISCGEEFNFSLRDLESKLKLKAK